MSSPLFRGSYDDFSMPPCANCGKHMVGIRYVLKIKGEKVRVCSVKCEDELREKHGEPRKPIKRKPAKPPMKIVDGQLVAINMESESDSR